MFFVQEFDEEPNAYMNLSATSSSHKSTPSTGAQYPTPPESLPSSNLPIPGDVTDPIPFVEDSSSDDDTDITSAFAFGSNVKPSPSIDSKVKRFVLDNCAYSVSMVYIGFGKHRDEDVHYNLVVKFNVDNHNDVKLSTGNKLNVINKQAKTMLILLVIKTIALEMKLNFTNKALLF